MQVLDFFRALNYYGKGINIWESEFTPLRIECDSLDKNAGSLILSFIIFSWIFCLFPPVKGGCKTVNNKQK